MAEIAIVVAMAALGLTISQSVLLRADKVIK